MKSVSRLFERLEDASDATEALVAAGFDRAAISLIAPHSSQSLGFDTMDEMPLADDPEKMSSGAALGVTAGAALGGATGLLMGLGLLVIPGIGPALAVGPLASALAGAGLGGATGGVAGALARSGIPPLDSNEYSHALRRGETLLFLYVPDDRVADAGRILDGHGPIAMDNTRDELLEGGHGG
ncbi:MAG: hypothetical protein WD314_07935 [Trueperaceae bacterium]